MYTVAEARNHGDIRSDLKKCYSFCKQNLRLNDAAHKRLVLELSTWALRHYHVKRRDRIRDII